MALTEINNSFQDFKKEFAQDKRDTSNTVIATNMGEYLEYAKLRAMDKQNAILSHIAKDIQDLKIEVDELSKVILKTSK